MTRTKAAKPGEGIPPRSGPPRVGIVRVRQSIKHGFGPIDGSDRTIYGWYADYATAEVAAARLNALVRAWCDRINALPRRSSDAESAKPVPELPGVRLPAKFEADFVELAPAGADAREEAERLMVALAEWLALPG